MKKLTVKKLANRDELNKACLKGGYLINIDPVQNVIHACDCQWTLKMDPQKSEGGNYYCEDYTEAIEWLKKKHTKFKDCNTCLSGRHYRQEES